MADEIDIDKAALSIIADEGKPLATRLRNVRAMTDAPGDLLWGLVERFQEAERENERAEMRVALDAAGLLSALLDEPFRIVVGARLKWRKTEAGLYWAPLPQGGDCTIERMSSARWSVRYSPRGNEENPCPREDPRGSVHLVRSLRQAKRAAEALHAALKPETF